MVLGVAFSGPYKVEEKFTLRPGQSVLFGEYAFQLTDVRTGDSHDHDSGVSGKPHDHTADPPRYIYSEAVLRVVKNNRDYGTLRPQIRGYASRPDTFFSEVDTVFSWGNEIYCNLASVDESGLVTVQVSLNPLVNWIWLGSVLLCLFPLLGMRPGRAAPED